MFVFPTVETLHTALRSAAGLKEEMRIMACVASLQRCWDIGAYSAMSRDTHLLRIQILTVILGLSPKH